jgi:hypothetical protein
LDNKVLIQGEEHMAETSTTLRSINSALAAGDTELAKSLMTDGIEWINVLPWDQPDNDELELLSSLVAQTLGERCSKGWTFRLKGRGLIDVKQDVIFPFLEEGAGFALSPFHSARRGAHSLGHAL